MTAVVWIDGSWERDGELAQLLYDELYRDFGVAREADWRHAQPGSLTVVALDDGGALRGSARLLPAPGDRERQVRQVVVAPEARGTGVGTLLMDAIETMAAEQGAETLWLNARDTAVAFYERRGFIAYGEWFVSELTGIPHVGMKKAVSRV